MADKKISQLPSLTNPATPDLLVIIDDPNGTPTSKRIAIGDLFGAIPANTVHKGTVRFEGNTQFLASNTVVTANINFNSGGILKANNVSITVRGTAPATNNAVTESLSVGQMFFTNTHLYIATDTTTIKRIALNVF